MFVVDPQLDLAAGRAVDEFLRLGATSRAALLAQLRAKMQLGDSDLVACVGSIAEGLGNCKSDLDLLWISPRSTPPREKLAFVAGQCLVDVEVCRLQRIGELVTRLESWAKLPWSLAHTSNFTLDERRLLHRLLNGHVLYAGRKQAMSRRLPLRADLARLKLHIARHMSRTIQVDMVGYREEEDYCSLVFAAQELLGHATDALLAGHHITNPAPKWRWRLLTQLPRNWERALCVRPTGLPVVDLLWRLHRAPSRPGKNASLEHAFRIASFTRAVFVWAEQRVLNSPRNVQWVASSGRAKPSSGGVILPHLDLDIDFAWRGCRVDVGRLNTFGGTLDISPRELALALLFDGKTTAAEAEALVFGSRAMVRGAARATRLFQRLTQANFTVHERKGAGPTDMRRAARRPGSVARTHADTRLDLRLPQKEGRARP